MKFEYDLVVIGAGSGGVRAARLAAGLGKQVAVIERQRMGGTCVNVGCIPKKLFHYAAQYGKDFHDAVAYGWRSTGMQFDWATLVRNKDKEIARLNDIYRHLLVTAGAEVIEGEGQITGAHTVQVNGNRVLSAERILIATGCAPWLPEVPGIELAITSNEFFSLPTLPGSAVIVGGGYIAVELASILHSLGVQSSLLHRGDAVLRGFDNDIRQFLLTEMQKTGIHFLLQENVTSIHANADGRRLLHCESGKVLDTDCVIYATGRKPVLDALGLSHTRVQTSAAGYVQVDASYQTAEPSIYAIGDVVGHKELTPVATAEAMRLVDLWYGAGNKPPVNYELVATAVFSSPEIGTVGISEEIAVERFGDEDIVVFLADFRALRHTLTASTERTLMKLVVQKSTDRVLGLHMVGADAGEITQGFAVAIQMGATKAQFDQTIGIHPTAAEEFVTMRTARKV
ncbi:MAG TPA: glutathione-disulfide reductase [Pseudomonadales bacterium]|nr:glutathione-disulfide reductase [Pseudomonadales bacterium]